MCGAFRAAFLMVVSMVLPLPLPLPSPLYCVVLRFGGLSLEGWCGAGTSDLVGWLIDW